MTGALSPELAVAYVREMSADVRAVAALGTDGILLDGVPALHAPARVLAQQLEHGVVVTPRGLAIVARGPQLTIVAVAGPHALPGPHGLDAAAAAGAAAAPEVVDAPTDPLCRAADAVIAAT